MDASFAAGRRVFRPFKSLRQAIILGIGWGVFIPALVIGGIVTHDRYQVAYHERVTLPLQQYAEILVNGLELPLWNVDPAAAQNLIDAVLKNPDVVRVAVDFRDLSLFVEREFAERRQGGLLFEKREIKKEGQVLGHLSIEFSSERVEAALIREASELVATFLVQLAFSCAFILLLLDHRLIAPLKQLRDAAKRFAKGDLDAGISGIRDDELGELARLLDEMRGELRTAFAEVGSQRDAAAAALQARIRSESENRLLAMVASKTSNAVVLTDTRGYVDWVNDGFCRLTGYSRDEVRGCRPGALLQGSDSDPQAIEALRACLVNGEAKSGIEIVNYAKDGRRYWVSIDIEPLHDGEGKLSGFFAIERDITEKINAAKALEANHQFISQIIESLPGIFYLINGSGRFVLWNHNFERVAERTADEMADAHPEDFFAGKEKTVIHEAIKQVFSEGEASTEASLVSKSGKTTQYYFTGLRMEMEGELHLLGVGIDISARKAAEERLEISEAKFSAAFHGSFDYITISRLSDSKFIEVNEAFERLTGWSSREALGTSALELGIWKNPEERAQLIARLQEEEKVHEFPMQMGTRNGDVRECLVSAFVVSIAGVDCLIAVARDVTESRKAEKALRASEAKFAATINGSAETITLSSLEDGRFALVNTAFEKMTGWSAAEAVGKTTYELGIWHKPEERAELIERIRNGEQVRNFRFNMSTKRGEILDCVMSGVPITIDGIVHVVSLVHDETEQRKADQALRRLAQGSDLSAPALFYQNLIGDLVQAIDFDMGFIGLRDPGQPLRINTRAVATQGGVAEQRSFDASGTPCEKVLAGETCFHADHVADDFPDDPMLTNQGYQSFVGAPLRGSDGQVVGLLAVMRTEPMQNTEIVRSLVQVFAERATAELLREQASAALEKNQKKFSTLFHSSPVAMTVSDRTNGYVLIDANKAWEKQFGITCEQVIGKNGSRIEFWCNPADREAVLRAVEAEGEIRGYEAWLRRGKDEKILCLISGKMVSLGEEELLILAEEDITERRQLEKNLVDLAESLEQRVTARTQDLNHANAELAAALDNLQLAQAELVRSEKLAALGSLVAGVAHELNTPIGNCVTTASTLDEQVQQFAGEAKKGLRRTALEQFLGSASNATDILMRNLKRASDLVASFKQVAVDQTSSQRRAFMLKDVVDELLTTLQPTIRLTPYDVACAVPDHIHCDSYPGLLTQVLANLVNNAILHGFDERNSGRISIAARQLSTSDFELTVADDGQGIPEGDQSRIFDPFFTTKLGKGGSGLGLHIVYNLVTGVLGGHITVVSAAGKGTCFTLCLPLVAPVRETSDGV